MSSSVHIDNKNEDTFVVGKEGFQRILHSIIWKKKKKKKTGLKGSAKVSFNDLSYKVCVSHKTEHLNICVFNMITGTNESRIFSKHL